MKTVFVVFALPQLRPGDRDFLAAYSSRAAAEGLISVQDAALRENMRVVEIELDRHPDWDGFWRTPD